MRLLISWLIACASAAAAGGSLPYFAVLSDEPGAWPQILSLIGLQSQPAGTAQIFVVRAGAPASVEWKTRVNNGAILILEGESSLAEMFGFRRTTENIRVSALTDIHQPKLSIVWEKSLELPVFEMPAFSAGSVGRARRCWPASREVPAPCSGWPFPLARKAMNGSPIFSPHSAISA